MSENKCDGAFIEEVEGRWEFQHTIDAFTFPRLLDLAKRGVQSEPKIFSGMSFREIQTAADAMSDRSVPMRVDDLTMLVANLAARLKEKE